jgi:methionine-S-sulfoxide reductase
MGKTEIATFAGGCFWCMQPPYDKLPGVLSTAVGYTGGTKEDPTYEEVCSGATGHTEAVQVTFDPAKVSYERLLEVFWRNIDPTAKDRQFADRGTQYRTGIFYHSEEQKRLALASKAALERSKKFEDPIVVEISPASKFYAAEDYHQCYYRKNAAHYEMYKEGSGRADYIERTWGAEKDG